MKHLGLFEGIGGFSLAARWMGWETVAWCEINPFCQKVLTHHFPKATGYSDIKETDFTFYANSIDILTGGFPCQPYSTAGKRKGANDSRHLWPEMLRSIREAKPRWVVGENVPGIVSWNEGLVFEQVQSDLEAEGYTIQPVILPAASVAAPHKRDRVWFIAYSSSVPDTQRKYRETGGAQSKTKSKEKERERIRCITDRISKERITTHPAISRLQSRQEYAVFDNHQDGFRSFPTVSPVCDANDGISGRLDGITFSKWRNESLKALGNAIVPQIALQIFKAIEQYETNSSRISGTASEEA